MGRHKIVKVRDFYCNGCNRCFDNIQAPNLVCPECGCKDHTPSTYDTGEYLYRGRRIQRSDDVPSGYWGRWRWGTRWASSRQELVAAIDAALVDGVETLIDALRDR